MKRVVAFGDSNTWGWNPKDGSRYGQGVRWTSRLQQKLGEDYKIIEEGLNGRTTVFDDPMDPYKRGKDMIVPILQTHDPVDLLVIMLGTNDLKKRFNVPSSDIAEGVSILCDMAIKEPQLFSDDAPEILLIAPAPLTVEAGGVFTECFEGGLEKSKRLGKLYKEVAEERNLYFLDAGQLFEADPEDGVHLSEEAHETLAEEVGNLIISLYS